MNQLNVKDISTSISAALNWPKKTFLINFPSRNTSTNAWMYNTWYQERKENLKNLQKKQNKTWNIWLHFQSYRHAGTALGEVNYSRVKLVFE